MQPILDGKIALITGGSSGIGRAAAKMLAGAGATVVITARTQKELDQTAREIRDSGGKAMAIKADVTDIYAMQNLAQAIHQKLGKIDIAVVNAGVIEPVNLSWKCDMFEWTQNIEVNLNGAFITAQIALADMTEKQQGTLIFISSGAASHPMSGWSAYCAAKAGVDHLNRTIALELNEKQLDIHSYSVYPGIVSTPMQTLIRTKTKAEFSAVETFKNYYENNLLRSPEDPAALVLWLCMKKPHEYHGKAISIDDEVIRSRLANDLDIEKPKARKR